MSYRDGDWSRDVVALVPLVPRDGAHGGRTRAPADEPVVDVIADLVDTTSRHSAHPDRRGVRRGQTRRKTAT